MVINLIGGDIKKETSYAIHMEGGPLIKRMVMTSYEVSEKTSIQLR